MSQSNSSSRNVFVAFVGSRPLVVEVDGWVPATFEDVSYDGEPVTYEGEAVTSIVV